jgi:ABC-type sugar transport system ATPase subunit
MSTIELRNLTKRFGDLTAVDSVDLFVDAGEVVCLLGPSGCGKTTLLRMISGLEEVSEGDVLVADKRVNDLAARERNIAMAFQFYALYPSLNVRENLGFPLHAEKAPQQEIENRVSRIGSLLHLDEVMDRFPHQLAEGEKQRVAVGRAIVREPNCFLFDEPLSRLDVELREQMRSEIKQVLAGLNKATVIVTHDQLEALTMADRVVVMRAGRIEQVATPQELFARPANLFVAGFIGTPEMNLLPARCVASGNGALTVDINGENHLFENLPSGDHFSPGNTLTVAFRPRNVTLSGEKKANTLTATIDLIEPMGPEVLLHARMNGVDLRIVVPDDQDFDSGGVINLQVDSADILLFDSNKKLVTRP